MDVPIIFLHYLDSYYIDKSIEICSSNNDHIIFLGDEYNKKMVENSNVEFHYLSDYKDEKNYQYLGKRLLSCFRSKDGPNFLKTELYRIFCVEKWIVLNNFLKKNKYKYIFTFDTDNFILEKLNYKNYEKYDFVRYSLIGPQSFIKTKIIYDFCNYIVNDERKMTYSKNIMEISEEYISQNKFKYLSGDIEPINNKIFDKCISLNSEKYESIEDKNDIDKISWNNNYKPKMIYYKDNDFYIKIKNQNIFHKLLTLNMSWVKGDFLFDVYSYITGKKDIIDYPNFKKINDISNEN